MVSRLEVFFFFFGGGGGLLSFPTIPCLNVFIIDNILGSFKKWGVKPPSPLSMHLTTAADHL